MLCIALNNRASSATTDETQSQWHESRWNYATPRSRDGVRAPSAQFATPQFATPSTPDAASLKHRIEQLLSAAIGFVDHPAFRREGLGLPAELQSALAAPCLAGHVSGRPEPGSHSAPCADRQGAPALLSKQQEQFLFCRMNYLKFRATTVLEQLNPANPSLRLVDAVERLLDEALEIRNRVLRANLRLVVFVANNFSGGRESLPELVSHGTLALIRAVEKFDFALGNRFSTYATRAIRNGLIRALQTDRIHRRHHLTGYQENLDRLSDDGGNAAVPEAASLKKYQYLCELLQQLSDREREIVMGRFALTGDGKKRTLAEIAETLRLSKERVRQISDRALSKLRAFAQTRPLELIEG